MIGNVCTVVRLFSCARLSPIDIPRAYAWGLHGHPAEPRPTRALGRTVYMMMHRTGAHTNLCKGGPGTVGGGVRDPREWPAAARRGLSPLATRPGGYHHTGPCATGNERALRRGQSPMAFAMIESSFLALLALVPSQYPRMAPRTPETIAATTMALVSVLKLSVLPVSTM